MMDFFEKLTDEIKIHDEIILMTHRTPDLDGLGSALVLFEIVKSFDKKCFIVAPKNLINKTLNKALNYLSESGMQFPFKYEKNIKDNNSLLIVLDTQNQELTESKDILSFKHRCVIDHHCLAINKIKSNLCEYLDSDKSSVAEILCDYLKYLDINLDSKYYTLLLAGLYQDTNYFTLNVTSDTFECASYLVSKGANINLQHDFLKESMLSVIKRYNYIKKCEEIDDNVYLSLIDDRMCTSITVAKLADEMLKFEEVVMAFAVGLKEDGQVVISGRSCDNRDVCYVMKKFGGGGHFGAAAACVSDSSIDEVIDKLKKIVRGK